MRRVKILQEMFEDICTQQDLEQLDSLYAKGFKSSAIVFMLRKVKAQWERLLSDDSLSTTATSHFQSNYGKQVVKITCATCQGETAYLQIGQGRM